MDGLLFNSPMPLRPIPVYGARNQASVPQQDTALFPPTVDHRHLQFSKSFQIAAHFNRFRSLGDYRVQHIASFGNSAPNQTANDVNKFSAKTFSIAEEIVRRHAISQQNAPNEEQINKPKSVGAITSPTREIEKPLLLADTNKPVMDGTVPVIIHCGNPFPVQYGYGRKVFPCPQCRYTTDRRNNLKRHMLTMHQACTKTLECCGLVFATKASLREHAMIFHYHGYTCFYCGRRFCRKALLKRHLSVHNGQKDFVCPVCDYATSHKSNLERHRKVHCRSEEQKYDSVECNADESKWSNDDVTDDNNNMHEESSEDEDEEIIVDSD
ncbi:zinc finger protein 343-like [Dreissena polymorpha]|uniref:C2H2-type domain-containing protein n=1 Tax=Dreissena polymorpha TaxID=45954 RepID=A0A9D4H1P5_DREPO|nr:zinc finger protein 343-like [Dreissena polymorpha]KAH3827784.1 hypothetical protein DPMN_129727 [Dreissena polymorpha]